jgi:hypothetical protein
MKETHLCLSYSPKRVRVHARELKKSRIGEAGLFTQFECPKRLDVLLIQAGSLLGKARCIEEAADGLAAPADLRGRLLHRVRLALIIGSEQLNMTRHDAGLLVRLHDRLERKPAAEQELNQPNPLKVFGGEETAGLVTDESGVAPSIEAFGGLARTSRQLEGT